MSVAGATFEGSEHVNQDRWGTLGEYAWVLDGATKPGFETGPASVRAFVDLVDASLRTGVAAGAPSLTELLRTAIADTARQWGARPKQSATLALVRRPAGGGGEWLVLCDAAIAHPAPDGAVLVTDTRLARVLEEEREALRRKPVPPAGARQVFNAAVEARRDAPGGFWTVSLDPGVADRALVGELPAGGPVVLMSDGVTDGLHAGYWADVGTAFQQWTDSGPAEVLDRYRRWLLTRSAPFDDVTLVRVE